MIVRWTPAALRDLESLHGYVAEDNLPAAAATVERILSGIEALSRHPDMGCKGRLPETRELIIAPYMIMYRAKATALELLAIIHSAGRCPIRFRGGPVATPPFVIYSRHCEIGVCLAHAPGKGQRVTVVSQGRRRAP